MGLSARLACGVLVLLVAALPGAPADAALIGHGGAVAGIALTPDGARVLSASFDDRLILWDLAGAHLLGTLSGHAAAVTAVAMFPDGHRAASGSDDRSVGIWSLPEGRRVATIAGNGFAVNALLFTPEGRLLSAAADTTVRLWDIAAKRELARYEGQDEPLLSLALTRDGAIVAAGGARGTLMLWHLADGSFIRARYAHQGPVFALAFTPDGWRLISGGLDAAIRVWEAPDWQEAGGALPSISVPDRPAERGAALFRKCSVCHDLTVPASPKAGPTLLGVFGRQAGTVPGYPYSPALRESGLVWNDLTVDRLFAFGPEAVVPGSKMPLQRMPDAKDRADLIYFLQRATRPAAMP